MLSRNILSDFFSFFKKRKSLIFYMNYLDENQSVYFQLDMGIRNNKSSRVDIQIFRQDVLEDFNESIDNSKGYLIILTFNKNKFDNDENYREFKKSIFYNNATHIDMYGNTYLIRCENKESVLRSVDILYSDVYKFSREQYSLFIEFQDLGKRKKEYLFS